MNPRAFSGLSGVIGTRITPLSPLNAGQRALARFGEERCHAGDAGVEVVVA
jgi:hypothetical protein